MRRVLIALALLALLPGIAGAQIHQCPLLAYCGPDPNRLPDGSAAGPSVAPASSPLSGLYFPSGNVTIQATNGMLTTPSIVNVAGGLTLWGASSSIRGGQTKSLTDGAAAVSFARIAVPTNGYCGGTVHWTANSTDGTNRLTSTASAYFACADTAGTVTAGAPQVIGTPATAYRRANTLVCTVSSSVVAATNCDLLVTCTDNLAGNQTMAIEWRVDEPTTCPVTAVP